MEYCTGFQKIIFVIFKIQHLDNEMWYSCDFCTILFLKLVSIMCESTKFYWNIPLSALAGTQLGWGYRGQNPWKLREFRDFRPLENTKKLLISNDKFHISLHQHMGWCRDIWNYSSQISSCITGRCKIWPCLVSLESTRNLFHVTFQEEISGHKFHLVLLVGDSSFGYVQIVWNHLHVVIYFHVTVQEEIACHKFHLVFNPWRFKIWLCSDGAESTINLFPCSISRRNFYHKFHFVFLGDSRYDQVQKTWDQLEI